jgi:hypothetical protein
MSGTGTTGAIAGAVSRPLRVGYGYPSQAADRQVYCAKPIAGLAWRVWVGNPSFVRIASTRRLDLTV